jgi:hypothetical protein
LSPGGLESCAAASQADAASVSTAAIVMVLVFMVRFVFGQNHGEVIFIA